MPDATPPLAPKRYEALDGLRGVAAIAVMVCHYTEHNGLHWLTGAWVAVDLFFILSGFVLMHSYGPKIEAGMRWLDFMRLRVLRLGPLYLVGLALGCAAALLHGKLHASTSHSLSEIATATALGSVLLPYLQQDSWAFGSDVVERAIFPLNDPAWSLFFEMFVNVLFVFYLVRLRHINHTRFAVIAMLLFALITVVFRQNNPGWGTQNFIFGFPRVIAEFFLGTAIYRVHRQLPMPPRAVTLAVLAVVLAGFFTSITALSMVNAFLFAPLLIVLLSRVDLPAGVARVCAFLGLVSYPLYITHYPIDRLLLEFYDPGWVQPAPQVLLASCIALTCAVALAYADMHLRRRWSARPRPQPAQSAA